MGKPLTISGADNPENTAKERIRMDKILEKIVQERMGITLERRGSDSEDFHDISVWALKEMLEKAYQAGKDSKAKAVRS